MLNLCGSSLAFISLFTFPLDDVAEEIRQENHIVLVNTLPKSGSVYIWEMLARHCGFPQERISLNRVFDDIVQEGDIIRIGSSKRIVQEHINASFENMALLTKYFKKILLHLRDPRQELISWFHHVQKNRHTHYHLWQKEICPPDEYYAWSQEDRLDWQIENFYPLAIKWIQEWCEVLDWEEDIEILVTHFKEMVVDQEAFFTRIAAFFDLPVPKWSFPSFSPGTNHQRLGSIDEWKMVLNERQQAIVNEKLPQDLRERFGWH